MAGWVQIRRVSWPTALEMHHKQVLPPEFQAWARWETVVLRQYFAGNFTWANGACYMGAFDEEGSKSMKFDVVVRTASTVAAPTNGRTAEAMSESGSKTSCMVGLKKGFWVASARFWPHDLARWTCISRLLRGGQEARGGLLPLGGRTSVQWAMEGWQAARHGQAVGSEWQGVEPRLRDQTKLQVREAHWQNGQRLKWLGGELEMSMLFGVRGAVERSRGPVSRVRSSVRLVPSLSRP